MATMFPRELPPEVRNAAERDGECRVFDALARLPGEFRVFYSVAWLVRNAVSGAWEGEADFVVAHPVRGILVVEVKGGLVSRDSASGQWFTETLRAGRRHEIKDPVAQARRSKYGLSAKLESMPRWQAGRPKLGHAVSFPHCGGHTGGLSPDCPSEIVLYAPDLENIEAAIWRIYDYWSGTAETCTPVDASAMRALVELLAPTVELRPAGRSRGEEVAATEVQIAELTRNQARVLKALAKNRRVAVSGGAGTGKTMLALAKAKNLADQGFRTLLTCYNRPLADHLRTTAHGCELLEVADFHQYCLATVGAAGLSVGLPDGADFWDVKVPNALVEALSSVPSRRFDAVVVDEGQDFAEGWWVPLQLSLLDPDHGILYIFYDDNQRLYKRANSFPTGLVEYCLYENLRNTKEIHGTAARFYSGGDLIAAGPNGPAVELVQASDAATQKREVGKLLDRLVRGGIKPADIAVLTGRSVDSSRLGTGGTFGSHRWTRDQERDEGRALFESISRFKGLERPAVILVELEDHVSAMRDESLYVGLSRARSSLAIVGTAEVLRYVGEAATSGDISARTDYLKALLGET